MTQSLQEQLSSAEAASKLGWAFIDIYPQPNQPWMLHDGFVRRGYEVADLPFDGNGAMVKMGEYALWVKMGPNVQLADCGCVHHAEQSKPCEHDIKLCLSR